MKILSKNKYNPYLELSPDHTLILVIVASKLNETAEMYFT